METYAKAMMGFYDPGALGDSRVSTSDNAEIGNIDLFKTNTDIQPYMTTGLNQCVLDGSLVEMPDAPDDVSFFSNEKSGADCAFETPPKVTVKFGSNHTSVGLTLHMGWLPGKIRVTWYNTSGVKLTSEEFEPDTKMFYCQTQVDGYGKIDIEFLSTPYPKRFVNLQFIDYGRMETWSDKLIKDGKITESISQTNATLEVNTCTLSLVDEKEKYNPNNHNGEWKSIQRNQEITVEEYQDGIRIPCGTFYVNNWSWGDNLVTFNLVDPIGYIGNFRFTSGTVYEGVTAKAILDSIMADAEFQKYTIEPELAQKRLYGYLPNCTCREAMQQLCFAIGGVADCSRSDTIKIETPGRSVNKYIGVNRRFTGSTRLSMDTYVSGVKITTKQYTKESAESEVFKGELPAGESRIEFSEPYTNLKTSAGTISKSKTNWCEIRMNDAGECIITGNKYTGVESTIVSADAELPAGETENIKAYSCTLYQSDQSEVLKNLRKYHSFRKTVDTEIILEKERVGEWIGMVDSKIRTSATLIESQEIDLTGGFVTTMHCRGYELKTSGDYMTGEELIAEGNIII